MPRFVTVSSIGLTLAIALAFGMVGWRMMTFSSPPVESHVVDPETGRAFYAALNKVLAGAGSSDLEHLVTEDYVDHTGSAPEGRTLEALVADLQTLGASFAGARLNIEDIDPSGQGLVVKVAPSPALSSKLAGLSLTAAEPTGGFEYLRLRRGKISERWSNALPPISATTAEAAQLWFHGASFVNTRLFRIDLPPGAELTWKTDAAIAMVEQGTLSSTVGLDDELGKPISQTFTVSAGVAKRIPPEAKLRLRATSASGAALLLFTMYRTDENLPWPFRLEQGARSKMLWENGAGFAVNEQWSVTVGLLQLPPGAEATLGTSLLANVVLCAQAGAIEVTKDGGTMRQLDAQHRPTDAGARAMLSSDMAVLISRSASIVLRAPEETGDTVWIVVVGPLSSIDASPELRGMEPGLKP